MNDRAAHKHEEPPADGLNVDGAWMVERGEICDFRAVWLRWQGLSVGSVTLSRFSRVQRAASSLPMQPHEPVVA